MRKKVRPNPFTHMTTFKTITMEKDLKNEIKSDLKLFLKTHRFDRWLDYTWKQSFLLYCSFVTRKSSFDAMVNFLQYAVYNMNLSKVHGGSDLKFLLIEVTDNTSSNVLCMIEYYST
ncbi:hypothetical protein RJT34_24665 [Clitoria ternatea]|uniref:Uncharacterized protein n=1 Tax=Clitoria ternatea TaxID=43366 RepID=A0AAN9IJE3_CLITE